MKKLYKEGDRVLIDSLFYKGVGIVCRYLSPTNKMIKISVGENRPNEHFWFDDDRSGCDTNHPTYTYCRWLFLNNIKGLALTKRGNKLR